MFKFKFKRH